MRMTFASAALLALYAGCGAPANRVQGSYEGRPIAAVESVSALSQDKFQTTIIVSTTAGTCEKLKKGQVPKNGIFITMQLIPSGNEVTAATYPVVLPGTGHSLPLAHAGLLAYDDQCRGLTHDGVTGSVTVTHVDDSGVNGSFDITLDESDHLTGTFGSQTCNPNPSAGATPTCE